MKNELRKTIHRLLIIGFILLQSGIAWSQEEIFNYKKALTMNRTLSANIQSINRTTGDIVFGGSDSRGPSTPNLTFKWIWGDGTSNDGFFPQSKKYTDVSKNYVVKVIANYSITEKDTVEVLVDFVKGKLTPIALDPKLRVSIPSQPFTFSNYSNPALIPFSDNFFTGISRADLEYLLHVGATIEYDFVNENVMLYNDKFEQFMLRDTVTKGAYSIWFSRPVGFGVAEGFVNGNIDFSSLYHEMGHNITLNFPAGYNFGGKIDGAGNAIFSETIAQIFQYSVGYEVINNYKKYGLDEVFLSKYKTNFSNGMAALAGTYKGYIQAGMPFASWNDPATATDETLTTFLTTAYKFYELAEQQGKGYRLPIKRLTQFLGKFDAEWKRRYDQFNNTPAASAFRATMMVAAFSQAFQKDLRADFRALNFPISDTDWAFLNPETLDVSKTTLDIAAAASSNNTVSITANVSWTAVANETWLSVAPASGSGNQTIVISALANTSADARNGSVLVLTASGMARTVNVIQAGMSPMLSVSTKTVNLEYSGENTANFDVTSNLAWTATSSQTWLSVSPGSGSQNARITVAATPNTSFESRKAIITIKAAGVADQGVEVTQGAPLITGIANFNNVEVSVFPNPVSNFLRFKGLSGKGSVKIYSQIGVLRKEVLTDQTTEEISIAELPSGLYVLQIVTSGYSGFVKVIKI